MSWEKVALPTICRPKQWPTIPKANLLDSGYPVFGANGRIGFYSDFNHEEATILITCRGATCGTINVCAPKSYVTGNAMALDDLDHERVDLQFMTYALQNADFTSIITGLAQPQITRQSLSRLQIPLPPLAEQKRIAGILDAADALRARRREALAQLDTLLQSTFLDMFGDPVTNPMGWDFQQLGSVLSLITYGLTVRPAYQPSGVPLVSASQIKTGTVDLQAANRISHSDYESLRDKCKPQSGDVLFSKTGAIGHTAILQSEEPIALAQNVARLVFDNDRINSVWALYYLRTEHIQRLSQRRAKGNAQKDLQLGEMEVFPIYVPPLDLQQRFAAIVESIEQQKARMRTHLDELDTLFASLQSRAFNGEL